MKGLLQLSLCVALLGGTIGCATAGTTAQPAAKPKVDPDLILAAEFDGQGLRDAYDIVQRLRPNWFTRKTGGSSARRMGTSGSGLVVYLDNARMGGVDALRQLNTSAIESLRFLDAAAATAQLPGLGSSVIAGAIVARSRKSF
jgi:hypothetical protein